MGKKDARVDQYSERSAEFARPILTHIRRVVHEACPDVVETMKWSAPHFDHKGIMCGMAAFKGHCAFGFWKAALVLDDPAAGEGMGSFGKLTMPADFAQALKKNKAAQRTFEAFSPSHKREYLEWVTEAKTDATRQKRMSTAIEWLANGKTRNWKYEPK